MKKIILAFATLSTIFFLACTNESSEISSDTPQANSSFRIHPDDKVGEIVSGNYVITANLTTLKDSLNAALSDEGITNPIVSFKIMESSEITGEYILVGKSLDNATKVGIDLSLDHNNFYGDNTFDSVLSTYSLDIVICDAGCSQGCDPEKYNDENGEQKWKCTNCVQFTGQGCRKKTIKLVASRSLFLSNN